MPDPIHGIFGPFAYSGTVTDGEADLTIRHTGSDSLVLNLGTMEYRTRYGTRDGRVVNEGGILDPAAILPEGATLTRLTVEDHAEASDVILAPASGPLEEVIINLSGAQIPPFSDAVYLNPHYADPELAGDTPPPPVTVNDRSNMGSLNLMTSPDATGYQLDIAFSQNANGDLILTQRESGRVIATLTGQYADGGMGMWSLSVVDPNGQPLVTLPFARYDDAGELQAAFDEAKRGVFEYYDPPQLTQAPPGLDGQTLALAAQTAQEGLASLTAYADHEADPFAGLSYAQPALQRA